MNIPGFTAEASMSSGRPYLSLLTIPEGRELRVEPAAKRFIYQTMRGTCYDYSWLGITICCNKYGCDEDWRM